MIENNQIDYIFKYTQNQYFNKMFESNHKDYKDLKGEN